MDAGELLEQEKFYCANCIATGAFKVEAYELYGSGLRIAADTKIDPEDLTDVGQSFLVQIGESFYGGGEAIAHRSPQEIMDEIAALDAESADVLETIKGLLK